MSQKRSRVSNLGTPERPRVDFGTSLVMVVQDLLSITLLELLVIFSSFYLRGNILLFLKHEEIKMFKYFKEIV